MALKKKKLTIGTVFQQKEGGKFYFRYQLDGRRKCITLNSATLKDAVKEAQQEHIPIIESKSLSAIEATTEYVKHTKGLTTQTKSILLSEAWGVYSQHPERATPATVSEQNAYGITFRQLVEFLNNPSISIKDIDFPIAQKFANYLRTTSISVDTHNRKIRRLRKIFSTLTDYYRGNNPFEPRILRRKEREEQGNLVRRMSFTKAQEEQIMTVLDDDNYQVINKEELKVIYYLGMFTGQRFKDCVLLQWDKVSLPKRRIWVKQFKTGKEVTIPIAPQLHKVLTDCLKVRKNQYVNPSSAVRYNEVDKNGKVIGNGKVNKDAIRVIKWIGLEPSVKIPNRKKAVTVYGFHSLRHSFASHCAEAGVPKAVVISILGASSDIIDQHYTHVGNEAQEKAIEAISGKFHDNTSLAERHQRALDYIASLKNKSKELVRIVTILTE